MVPPTRPDSRVLVAVTVGALVLLAGCGGTATPTANASPGTTPTPTATSTPDRTATPGSLAPGVSGPGVTDVDALLDAHRTALLADGAVVTLNVSAGGDSQSDQRLTLGPDARDVVVTGSGVGVDGPVSVDTWLNDSVSLFRFAGNGSTDYRVLDPLPERARLLWAGNVDAYLRATAPDLRVTGTETRDGTRYTSLAAESDLVNDSGGADTTVALTVSESGVLRAFDLVQDRPDGGTYRVTYRVVELGAAPAPPAWVEDVPAGSYLDVSLDAEVQNGSTVVVSNDGPDAVPDGSTVRVVAGGVTYDVTLDDGLAPGETRYLWVDGGGTIAVGDTPPTDGAVQLGGRAVVTVETPDGVRLLAADLAWRPGR